MSSDWWATSPNMHHRLLSHTNYRPIIHTKRLLYYSRRSFSTAELHASSDWQVIYPDMHRNRLLVQHFVHISGKRFHCVTSLCISLGQSFWVCVWAFRLVACIIHLTMLQQYSTFGHYQEKTNLLYRCRSCVKLSCCGHLPCCHSLWSSLSETHKNEWN